MTLAEILSSDTEFQYMLLSRLESDCKYFLGNGARHEKHLWALNVEDHIHYMKEIWKNLEIKPEWLSFNKIKAYHADMEA